MPTEEKCESSFPMEVLTHHILRAQQRPIISQQTRYRFCIPSSGRSLRLEFTIEKNHESTEEGNHSTQSKTCLERCKVFIIIKDEWTMKVRLL